MTVVTDAGTLDALRSRYERDGYSFAVKPYTIELPDFMAGYVPDAIAHRADRSIAIAISHGQSGSAGNLIKELSDRFRGRQGWQLHVVYADDLADVPVPAPDRTQILQRLPVIESMAANDNRDAALVLAWAALEATARVIAQESAAPPPRSPKEALQLLEHLGLMDFSTAQSMRSTLGFRNQVVHGDYSAAIPPHAVADVVEAIRATLAA